MLKIKNWKKMSNDSIEILIPARKSMKTDDVRWYVVMKMDNQAYRYNKIMKLYAQNDPEINTNIDILKIQWNLMGNGLSYHHGRRLQHVLIRNSQIKVEKIKPCLIGFKTTQ